MNQRYIEAMARAAVGEPATNDPDYVLNLDALEKAEPAIKRALAALIATLREDPGAVEAMAKAFYSLPFNAATAALNGLCDYLEQGQP